MSGIWQREIWEFVVAFFAVQIVIHSMSFMEYRKEMKQKEDEE